MMHSNEPLSAEEVQRQIREQVQRALAESNQTRYGQASEEALIWLALTPGWTVPLAQACEFPGTPGGPAELFERLQKSGQLERRYSRDAAGADADDYFVMIPSARAEVLSLQAERLSGRRSLRSEQRGAWRSVLSDIGNRMQTTIALPSGLRAWANLAAHAATAPTLVAYLNERIAGAFQSGSAAQLLDVIEAARWIEPLATRDLDTSVKLALQRASRCLELVRRRSADEDHLSLFLRRNDQLEAIARFMSSDERAPWAIHFIGAGGVGKTMLLRYLTSQLAQPATKRRDFGNLDVALARIDFDYLNADYPSLAPGLMLWAFGQELRAYDQDGSATANFNKADAIFEEMHKSLRVSPGKFERPSAHPQFAQAVSVYIDALRCLRCQVLLIVDTCEELGRTRDSGGALPNVEETFRILRALHDGPSFLTGGSPSPNEGLANIRVLFSGRRPLASSGAGWRCTTAAGLPDRSYLLLHELRGFTHDEARDYLAHAKIPEDLVESVIKASMPEAASAVTIECDNPRAQPVTAPRCNPYNLRLYVDWAKEEPPPRKEDLEAAGSDQYVELRILSRLRNELLEQAMPVVAMLGHFDVHLLRAAIGPFEAVQELFDRLGQQEWIGYRSRSGPYGINTVLDVQPGVRRLLLSYYSHRPALPLEVRERAAAYLKEETLEEKLDFLDWSHFDAALGAWEHDPEAGARWWQNVEARLFAQRDAAWIAKLIEPLLGADGAAGEPEVGELGRGGWTTSALRPFVLATQAAALTRMGQGTRALNIWQQVRDSAGARDSLVWRMLNLRALCVSLTTCATIGQEFAAADVADFCERVNKLERIESPQLLASLVAAAEALLEKEERARIAGATVIQIDDEGRPFKSLAELAQETPGKVGPNRALAAAAFSFAGRAIVLGSTRTSPRERWQAAADHWFRESIALVDRAGSIANELRENSPWADWVSPENLSARIRLEYLRAAYPALISSKEALDAVAWNKVAWSSESGELDHNRLHSMLLTLALATSVEYRTLAAWLGDTPYPPGVRLTHLPISSRVQCNAHLLVPPLLVSCARVYEAQGNIPASLNLLWSAVDRMRRADPLTWKEALAELMRLARRYRLDDHAQRICHAGARDDTSADWPLELWPMLALTSAQLPALHVLMDVPPRSEPVHAIWRSLYARDPRSLEAAMQLANHQLLQSGSIDVDEVILVDELELGLMQSKSSLLTQPITLPPSPATELRRTLRLAVLLGASDARWQDLHEGAERCGYRHAAEIALDEGELLALRLPKQAARLLECAAEWFERSSDRIGKLLAYAVLAIHTIDTDDVKRRKVVMAQLKEAYNLCRELLQLPAWQDLAKLATSADAAGLNTLQPEFMRPWLLRIGACIAADSQGRGKGLLGRVRYSYPPPEDQAVTDSCLPGHLPAEWRLMLARSPDAGTRPAAKKLRPLAVLQVAFGGIVGVGLLVLMFTLFTKGVAYFKPDFADINLTPKILTFLGTLGGVGWLGSVLQSSRASFKSVLIALGELAIAVRLRDAGASTASSWQYLSSATVTVMATWFAPAFGYLHVFFPYLPAKRRAQALSPAETMAVSAEESYAAIADAVPETLRDAILECTRSGRRVEVSLTVAAGLHHFGWEYAIVRACAGSMFDELLERRIVVRRLVSPSPNQPPIVPWRTGFNVRALAGNQAAREVAQQGWRRKAPSHRFEFEEESILTERDYQAAYDTRNPAAVPWVLHVIGHIEQTSAGLRLRLNELPFGSADGVQSVAPIHQERSAEELARKFPQACILQAQLAEVSGGERMRTDRFIAGQFRAFAAELAAIGVPYVVVIPALPAAVAVRVVEELAGALWWRFDPRYLIGTVLWPRWKRERVTRARVAEAIVRIRRIIAGNRTSTAVDLERPFDVCFYCRADDSAERTITNELMR